MTGALRRDVAVRLGERSYSVRIGSDLIEELGSLVTTLAPPSSLVIVTNPTVRALYGSRVERALRVSSLPEPFFVEIPDGERYKTVATVERVYDECLDHGIDRHALLLAVGGGVVGDVTGFAAATLLRGVRFVQVPTTLLAQVDSSVGGKTGVNREQGKNLVGAFYQPSLVVADPTTFDTLPDREYRAGLAEVVKKGMVLDHGLFERLEDQVERVRARDASVMTDIVARCVELKADVVERDETEQGMRRVLNFGHTVGHAIERATEYSRFLHGEAVAMGMVAAARISERVGACASDAVSRLKALLTALGLETEIPQDIDRRDLAAAIAHDKKARDSKVTFIVCDGGGGWHDVALTPEEICRHLER